MTDATGFSESGERQSPRLVVAYTLFSKVGAIATAGIGCLVIAGWSLDIPILKSFGPDWVAMKANTALSLILLGLGLLLVVHDPRNKSALPARPITRILGVVVALLALLTLGEYVIGHSFGIDQLLFREPPGDIGTVFPGRMAPNTALSFLFFGTALLLLGGRSRTAHAISRHMVALGGMIGTLAILGYAYGVSELYDLTRYTAMAFPAAAAIVLFSLSFVCAHPERGIVSIAASDSSGGAVLRRLLPISVGIVFLLGWLVTLGEKYRLLDTALGVSIFAAATIVMLVALTSIVSRSLHFADLDRKKGAEAGARLAAIVESSDAAIISKSLDGTILTWNASAQRLYGYTASEAIGQSVSILTPKHHEDEVPAILAKIAIGERVQSYETERLRKDGTLVPVSLTVSPVRDSEGTIVRASTIARDISIQKKAQADLARKNAELSDANEELSVQSEELQVQAEELQVQAEELQGQADELTAMNGELRATVEELDTARAESDRRAAEIESFISSMVDGVCLADAEGKVISVNEAGRRILRVPEDETLASWMNKCLTVNIDGTPIPAQQAVIYRALRGASIRDFRYIAVTPLGNPISLSVGASPVRDAQGSILGATFVFRDISEQVALEKDRQKLYEREHHIAEMLQQVLIPSQVTHDKQGVRIAARYAPALKEADVGGDFYDVFDISEGRLGIVIGDVAGKGLLAAKRVAGAKHAIRSYAYVENSPATVMKLANNALCRDEAEGTSLLTAFFAVLDSASRKITYANGGHEPPIVLSADGNIVEMDVTGLALGVIENTEYEESCSVLGSGDIVVMMTDGITEARRKSVLLGKESVMHYLCTSEHPTPDGIATGLLELATSFAGGHLQDDAAIVVVRTL